MPSFPGGALDVDLTVHGTLDQDTEAKMEALRSVRWREGMFLRPHHFQQLEQALASREACRAAALQPLSWGVAELELDESQLSQLRVGVKKLRAVLPSGVLVDVPGNAKLEARGFEELASEPGRAFEVSVGLRHAQERVAQSGDAAVHPTRRFAVEEKEVFDLDSGEDPLPLEFQYYNLRFFLSGDVLEGYETLPLVRLVGTGDPAAPVKVDADFAPPVIRLGGSAELLEIARGVTSDIALVLKEHARHGIDAKDASRLVLHQALSGALPVFRDLVRDGACHPRVAYREMARLAGTLLYRGDRGSTQESIPDYDHRDLGGVFRRLAEMIRELSKDEYRPRYLSLPMSRVSDAFHVEIPPEGLVPGCGHYLEVKAQQSAPLVKALIEQQSRISTPARVEHLRQFQFGGIGKEQMPAAPAGGPVGEAGTYFRLKTETGPDWAQHVVPEGELAVDLRGAPPDIEMRLIVVLPKG